MNIREIKVENTKNGYNACYTFREFLETFREDYDRALERFFENHDIDITDVATRLYVNKYNIDVKDVELYEEQDFLDILQTVVENKFAEEFQDNWNTYGNTWCSPKGVEAIYKIVKIEN